MSIKEKSKDLLRPIYRQFLAAKNKGDNVTCNICGGSYKSLRPVMGQHADGSFFEIKDHVGSCWLCNSYPRTRQMYYWLTNDFKIESVDNLKLLHVAPEVQISNKLRKFNNLDYICIDKHCPGYHYPNYVQNGDVCKIEFDDNTFDMVICNHVLEHILDDKTAMTEIKRVLKKNGVAILMVPIDLTSSKTIEEGKNDNLSATEREQRFGQYDHVRLYGRDYFDRLNDAGFNVERKTYSNELSNKYGFMHGEELVICRKR